MARLQVDYLLLLSRAQGFREQASAQPCLLCSTMSFGYSVGDFVLLTQLAWRSLQNARRACGEHDELAREASSLHVILQRLEIEVSKPHSIFN